MRPANWKPIKNCEMTYGKVFFDSAKRVYINVSTDYSIDGLWEMHDEDDDDEIVSLVVVELPKTFDEFRTRYAYVNWEAVRRDLDDNTNPHFFDSLLRDMRFAKGATAACLFASLLEDVRNTGGDIAFFGMGAIPFRISDIKAGDMKRIFDPSYTGAL
jgi:hypothetical protein